jgi:hypothetical protein
MIKWARSMDDSNEKIVAYSLEGRIVESQQLIVSRPRFVKRTEEWCFLRSPCRWLHTQQWNTYNR